MKYGVTFPQYEIGADPAVIRDYVQTVEGLGYDFILAYDHVLGANPQRPGGWKGPYTDKNPFHEVMVLFGYFAALTQRLELTTGILIAPQRQTALVAKQAAQVDILSGGRLRLGVGIGWNRVEYDALGYDFSQRGARAAEQVELMKRLWTEPLVTAKTGYEFIDDAGIQPMPVQQPIPVWFGGRADAVLRRMAKLGDGWMPGGLSPEAAKPMLDTLHGYLQTEGRTEFGLEAWLKYEDGNPAMWEQRVHEWDDIAVTHMCFNTLNAGLPDATAHLKAVTQWATTMGVNDGTS